MFNRLLRQSLVDEGYAGTQILSQLHEAVIERDLNDKQKSAITEKMAVSDLSAELLLKSLSSLNCCYVVSAACSDHSCNPVLLSSLLQVVSKCLSDGADEYLQLLSLCSVIMQEASHN